MSFSQSVILMWKQSTSSVGLFTAALSLPVPLLLAPPTAPCPGQVRGREQRVHLCQVSLWVTGESGWMFAQPSLPCRCVTDGWGGVGWTRLPSHLNNAQR